MSEHPVPPLFIILKHLLHELLVRVCLYLVLAWLCGLVLGLLQVRAQGVTTRDGKLQLYALLPTTRPYVEHHLEQTYDRELLKARFIRVYAQVASDAYAEVSRSTVLARQVSEDLERVCKAVEEENIVIDRGLYLFRWGSVVYRLGNSPRGLRLLERALEMAQGTDSNLALQISNNMAVIYRATGYPQEALRLYERALPIVQEVRDRDGEAKTLNNMALVYDDMGYSQEALRLYEQALPIMQEVRDRNGEAATLNNIAEVYRFTGRLQKALEHYEQALLMSREIKNRGLEGAVINNMALVYKIMERHLEALDFYEQALLISREIKNRAGEAATLNNIAEMYNATGHQQGALKLYENALPIMREVGDRAGEAATLNNMATVHATTGHPEEALKLCEDALPIMREVGNRAGEATTLNNLAHFYQSLQRYSDAVTAFEQSIVLSQKILYPAVEITSLIGLASLLYSHFNRPADAITSLEKALQIFAVTGLPQDAAGQTIEQAQQFLMLIRNEAFSVAPSHAKEEPLPFNAELVSKSIKALHSGPQEKMEYAHYITTLLAETTDEQFKALINVIQLALFGDDSLQLGHHLEGVYRQTWETILAGLTTPGEEII